MNLYDSNREKVCRYDNLVKSLMFSSFFCICKHCFIFAAVFQYAKLLHMLHIILIILAGILTGYILKNVPFIKYVATALSVIIVLLLFFLGVSVGANEQVVNNFVFIGLDAFILTVGGLLGSVLCAWWVYMKFFKKKSSKE